MSKKEKNAEKVEKKEKPVKEKKESALGQMFKTKAFRAGGYSTAAAAIVIIIAVIINLLVSGMSTAYTNVDTTSTGLYSLSEQTKDVVSSLEKDVTIYYIVSPDKETEYVDKILAKFKACGSKLNVEKIDPDVDPDFASKYTDESISNGDIIVVCGDKAQVVYYNDMIEYEAGSYEYYMYYLQYQNQQTAIYWKGEIQLLKAIDSVTSDKTYNAYFLDSTGSADFSALTALLDNENIVCDTFEIKDKASVPDDASCVVITDFSSDISDDEYAALKTYLQSGGKLYVAADYSADGYKNLENLLSDYGLSFTSSTLKDGDRYYESEDMIIPSATGEHAIISPFTNGSVICFPETMGIKVSETANITVTPLIVTSASGYLSTDPSDDLQFETFNLGVVADDKSTGAQIVVYGSSKYSGATYTDNSAYSNSDLFVNSVGYLCDKDSAVSIHAKTFTSDSKIDFTGFPTGVLIAGIAVLPAVVAVVTGFIIWYRRKNS